MKRRKFIINSILVGIACVLPLPKIKKKLRVFASQYRKIPLDVDYDGALTPEMLDNALSYFEHQPPMPRILDPKTAIKVRRLQKGAGDTYSCHVDIPLNLNKRHFTIFKK